MVSGIAILDNGTAVLLKRRQKVEVAIPTIPYPARSEQTKMGLPLGKYCIGALWRLYSICFRPTSFCKLYILITVPVPRHEALMLYITLALWRVV